MSDADTAGTVARLGARLVDRFEVVSNLYLVRLPPELTPQAAAAALRAQGTVAYAEPNYTLRIIAAPNDPDLGTQWGLHNTGQSGGTPDADIDAPEAWDITTGSPTVVVAVLDTGAEYSHADLAANMFRNEADCNTNGVDDDGNGHIDDCHGIDALNNDSDPLDDNGHGTHISGTIGAVGNNGTGVTGVNWNVRLMACKFLDAGGTGSIAGAVTCLNYLAMMKDRGVNLVATNNSWSGGGFSQSLLDAIEAHRQRGILFVAAAGNAASDNDEAEVFPANYDLPNIISVASTTRTDGLSSFSNFGRQTVHVGAPGSEILSTSIGNAYAGRSGTSMAAPHVTGVAALLKAQDAGRDWRAIRNLVLAAGDSIAALTGTTVTGRRINAAGSLSCVSSVVQSRVQPVGALVTTTVGDALTLRVLHVNCANPNGGVSVTANGPTSQIVALVDDGLAPDQVAGDGVYSGQISFSAHGSHTLTYPGGDVVNVQVLKKYRGQSTAFSYRAFTGTSLNVQLDQATTLATPFPIRFGAGSFSNLFISPNGIAGVSAGHVDYLNTPIPIAQAKAFVAAFWDDLYPTSPISDDVRNVFWTVLGSSPDRELAIEWRNLGHFSCAGDSAVGVTFQMVFFEGSSQILVNYADTTMGGACTFADSAGSATVGVQVASGRGRQWSDNAPVIAHSTAILWSLPGPFTDEVVTAGSITIRAVHVTELRDRIDALRTGLGLALYSWTDPVLAAGSTDIRAVHLQQLRTALGEAYAAQGQTPPAYTDPTIVAGATMVRSVHIIELRAAVIALE
jgi:subtilisin family serine protease